MKIFVKFLFPRYLRLGVIGWDDLIMAAASAVIQSGAQSAMAGSSSSTAFGNVPQMEQQQDPWAWFAQLAKRRHTAGQGMGEEGGVN